MANERALRYRDLRTRLRPFGVQEEDRGGGRRMLFKEDVEGQKASYPIHPHSEHHEFGPPIIRAILRRFKIPPDVFWNA